MLSSVVSGLFDMCQIIFPCSHSEEARGCCHGDQTPNFQRLIEVKFRGLCHGRLLETAPSGGVGAPRPHAERLFQGCGNPRLGFLRRWLSGWRDGARGRGVSRKPGRVAATCGGARPDPRPRPHRRRHCAGGRPALHPTSRSPRDHPGPNTRPAWPEAPTVPLLSHGSDRTARGCRLGGQWHAQSRGSRPVTPSASRAASHVRRSPHLQTGGQDPGLTGEGENVLEPERSEPFLPRGTQVSRSSPSQGSGPHLSAPCG